MERAWLTEWCQVSAMIGIGCLIRLCELVMEAVPDREREADRNDVFFG